MMGDTNTIITHNDLVEAVRLHGKGGVIYVSKFYAIDIRVRFWRIPVVRREICRRLPVGTKLNVGGFRFREYLTTSNGVSIAWEP